MVGFLAAKCGVGGWRGGLRLDSYAEILKAFLSCL